MPELNIDHSEIKKFEVLASRWWDKESKFKRKMKGHLKEDLKGTYPRCAL